MRWAWPLLALSLLAAGCDNPPLPVSCGTLPDQTACPVTGPDTCSDASCSALYLCDSDGNWVYQGPCEGYEGQGGGGAGGAAGAGGSGGQATCNPATSNPGLSCPSLQGGDCDVGLIDSCIVDNPCDYCEGFLRCENGNWSDGYVAYCNEDREVVINE